MEGGSNRGYFAIRMKSDIIHYETAKNGTLTQEKYCGEPGLFCGLIFLTDVQSGRPLALLNDGVLQHMRVGADGGIGVKYMSRPDSKVIGMLGSGGMAETHMKSFTAVRDIRKLQIYSPTRANREAFGQEMADIYGIEVQVCDQPEQIYKGADIVASLTNATKPALDGRLLEPGTHVVNIGGGGLPDQNTIERVGVYLRFGDAPPPRGHEGTGLLDDEYLTWQIGNADGQKDNNRAHRGLLPEKRVSLSDLAAGRVTGRTSDSQITWSERGNVQGAQFHAVAGVTYEAAQKAGLGHPLPDEWFLQTIRN
jgi:ornithine cyclodeaminase/alanine dehydrogenase-like protein (mu-crystallin family)